jgi:hypothetical protein
LFCRRAEGPLLGLAAEKLTPYFGVFPRRLNLMRKQLLIGALVIPCLALAQATKTTSETKVESTTNTPNTQSDVTTDKTVKQKTDGSTSSTMEHTTTQKASSQPTKKTHTKKTVEKDANGNVTKSETINDKK